MYLQLGASHYDFSRAWLDCYNRHEGRMSGLGGKADIIVRSEAAGPRSYARVPIARI
jgi:hypothetical protein